MTLYQVEIGKVVTFVDNSTGKDSTVTYTWDYGDGSPQEQGFTATHIYNTLGTYTITHSVKNSCNTLPSTCSTHQVEVVEVGQVKSGISPIIKFGIGIAIIAKVLSARK